MSSKADQFKPLTIPRKALAHAPNFYRVYKDAKEFVKVEASNALEALQKSGMQQAVRIEQDILSRRTIVELGTAENPATAKPGTEAAKNPAAETTAPAATGAEAQKPLSTEEVDKLLKN